MWRLSLRRAAAVLLVALSGAATAATTVCTVNYSTRSDWATGFVVDIVINNKGTAPITDWKADWKYDIPVKLVNSPWRAVVTINGGAVSATDNGTNPVIATGGSVGVGMALSNGGSTTPAPAGLSVGGKDCIVGEALYVDPNSNAANWVRAQQQYWVDAYKEWISEFAGGIGSRKAIVILEPDAIPQLDCLPEPMKAARLEC